MKEIKEDTKNVKTSYINRLEKLILLKCPNNPKQVTDSMQFNSVLYPSLLNSP
jgi:hypothetical protein